MRRVVTMTVDARVDIVIDDSTSFEDAKRQAKEKFWRLNHGDLECVGCCPLYAEDENGNQHEY